MCGGVFGLASATATICYFVPKLARNSDAKAFVYFLLLKRSSETWRIIIDVMILQIKPDQHRLTVDSRIQEIQKKLAGNFSCFIWAPPRRSSAHVRPRTLQLSYADIPIGTRLHTDTLTKWRSGCTEKQGQDVHERCWRIIRTQMKGTALTVSKLPFYHLYVRMWMSTIRKERHREAVWT